MIKSQSEISLWRQVIKTAEQGIISCFSATQPGMNRKEIELLVLDWFHDKGTHTLNTFEVYYGKMITSNVDLQNEIQSGDFLSINLIGRLNDVAFDLKRVTVLGQPTTQQKDFLDHLIEAADWMVQTIVPGRSMTFYPAESRGRLIMPIAYEIDPQLNEVQRISAREQFSLPIGMVLCVAPSIKSPEFGTMTHSEMILLQENGPEILR